MKIENGEVKKSLPVPLCPRRAMKLPDSREALRRCHIFVWQHDQSDTQSYLAILDSDADANFVGKEFMEKLGFEIRRSDPYKGPHVKTKYGPVFLIAQIALR